MDLTLPEPPPEPPLKAILRQSMEHLGTFRWELQDYFDRIAKKGKRDKHPGVHPSDLGRDCGRSHAYALVNAPRGNRQLDRQTVQCFNHGDAIHLQWQVYLLHSEDMGLLQDVEVEVPVLSPLITGTTDARFSWQGHRYHGEIKSAGPNAYYGTKDLRSPGPPLSTAQPPHRKQLHAYMAADGVEGACFIYVDKAMDDFQVIWQPFDDAIWEPVRRDLEFAAKMVEVLALPKKTENIYQCRNCPFSEICDDDMDLREADRRTT